jgi:hypothetical protein
MPLTRTRALEFISKLGAKEARYLASEESKPGGAPAVARHLLLAGVWSNVVDDADVWMNAWADERAPIPSASRRMLDKGIDPADLTDVVRDL